MSNSEGGLAPLSIGRVLSEEGADNKGLKFSFINYIIAIISIGSALSGFPQKSANNAEMRSG